MTEMPLIFNFQYDYGVKLVFVTPQDTMDEVARKSAFHTAGKLVKMPPPGAALRVRVQGETRFLPRKMSVEEAKLKPMETIQILVEGTPEYESALKATVAADRV